ncbi:unnamed protein product [Rotaria sp. Silwood1]|nr:unnamed protein product [Rotaria sp. Silwood1]CAF1242781.1 unnamed protein product [Rotaria sp. Silwood1]CAF3514583.1 unnamed protein product [Rotaria sp. Silwood1]CAF4894607.1 unnamed protein product [Rotaria sp. Silwood1]
MTLRRSIMLFISYVYRSIASINRNYRCWIFVIVAATAYVIIFASLSLKKSTLSSESIFVHNDLRQQQRQDQKTNENVQNNIIESCLSSCINKASYKRTLRKSRKKISPEARSRYSFIDIDQLNVDINYLDKIHRPSQLLNISVPPVKNHPDTHILKVKGNPSVIIYNRLPQCYEYTMRSLLEGISYLHSYSYVPSKIYVPFSYNKSALISIAQSLNNYKFNELIYERHIYFFDYHTLKFPNHPVWINLVRDPISRLAAEYQRSREICRKTNRCFVQEDRLNETLDECVARRSAKECISSQNGIARMLPFFCGLTFPKRCQEENNWALQKAKQNINVFYTVVGIAEHFYKFLYVLERLLPKYFKLSRLLFMNQQNSKLMADKRDLNVQLPNNTTREILMPLLKYEYDLYNHIKKRFLRQYEILLELDN